MSPILGRNSRFYQWRTKNKTTYLLGSLILMHLVSPYLVGARGGTALLNVAVSFILITAALAVSDNRRHTRIGIALVVPSLAIRWFQLMSGQVGLPAAVDLFEIAFLVFTSYIVLRYVLATGPITRDKLYGAATVYLLVATVFADAYHLLEKLQPGSFSVGEHLSDASLHLELGYLSLVTLTTLGFGDIAPLTPKARSMVVMEAFFGVMYMALLVARLVSMYRSEADSPPDESS